jgi:hypothetical protein
LVAAGALPSKKARAQLPTTQNGQMQADDDDDHDIPVPFSAAPDPIAQRRRQLAIRAINEKLEKLRKSGQSKPNVPRAKPKATSIPISPVRDSVQNPETPAKAAVTAAAVVAAAAAGTSSPVTVNSSTSEVPLTAAQDVPGIQ